MEGIPQGDLEARSVEMEEHGMVEVRLLDGGVGSLFGLVHQVVSSDKMWWGYPRNK